MSLSLALNNALSGIKVTQQSLSVLAHNTANANTEGYSRQIVQQSQLITGSIGAGTRIDQIVRKIDEYMNRAVQQQTSKLSQAETMSDYMSRIQIQMGDPGGTNSLDEQIEDFFNLLQSMATAPELASSTYQVAQSANSLAKNISGLALEMQNLRYQADQDLQAGITQVNSNILRLQAINESIGRAYALGESTASLLDERDKTIRTISEYVDVKVNTLESGQVYIYTSGGTALLEHIPSRITYPGTSSADTFKNNGVLGAVTIDGVKNDGTFVGRPTTLVTSGVSTDIKTILSSGKLKALVDLRDQEIPAMLSQLDEMASTLRDQLNTIHNSGSGMPPASTLTGTRAVGREDTVNWTGKALVAVLNPDGTTPNANYASDTYGQLPLELDFNKLRSEYPEGVTVETIMKEINMHFTPQNHAAVGGLNNISLTSLTNNLPGTGTFNFDLEMTNLSDLPVSTFITAARAFDSTGTAIGAVTTSYPTSVSLNAANTFTTVPGSNIITVASTAHGLAEGSVVTFDALSVGSINGIPASELSGHSFRITNVTANSFDVEAVTVANGTLTPVSDGAASVLPAYDTTLAGKVDRTGENGSVSVNLAGFTASPYYTMEVDVMVDDGQGNLVSSTISYRVANNQNNTINNRYGANSVTGAGTLDIPRYTQPLAQAILVNDKGLPAGPNEKGYLKIVGQPVPGEEGKSYTIAIDDLDSKEIGKPSGNPPTSGTGWGFSHYYGLNDLFVANQPTDSGDKVLGSALNLAIRSDILANPNLLSTGTITRGLSTADSTLPDNYTFERTAGSNSVAQKLADLGITQMTFDAAGNLSSSKKTFNGYASEILSYAASRATTAETNYNDQTTLMTSYKESVAAVSGVNIDEEMANTVILQNSYAASAQVIKVVKDLFDVLMQSF